MKSGAWLKWFKINSRKRKAPQRDWTKTLPYALLALLATLVSAGAGAYTSVRRQGPTITPTPTSTPTPTPTPTPIVDPSPSPTPEQNSRSALTATDLERQRRICSEWTSLGSGKRYNFVCRSKNSFDINVVEVRGSEKLGTGTILEDNSVEIDVMISPGNRNAPPRHSHWKLVPSHDGKRLEGMHSGNDPRETFPLVFRRAR